MAEEQRLSDREAMLESVQQLRGKLVRWGDFGCRSLWLTNPTEKDWSPYYSWNHEHNDCQPKTEELLVVVEAYSALNTDEENSPAVILLLLSPEHGFGLITKPFERLIPSLWDSVVA